jgi:PTH1 family peptidyl-tRNA hydrolase
MFLLVGLGNPGVNYQLTKHNFGFMAIDAIAENYQFSPQSNKFDNQVFTGKIDNQNIIAIKPQNFMNLSGSPVLKMMSFYKIELKNIIVFHDDIDLNLGRIKVKIGGGNGGHNGLKDIDQMMGKDYTRVRLGVGRPENPEYEVSDYVLSRFNHQEMDIVNQVNKKTSQLLPLILQNQFDDFMNQFALKN